MEHDVTKIKIISSLIWKFMERCGVQGIQLIVLIILARLLLPEDFGLIVLVTVFINIGGIIVQSGFNNALIQKKNVDEIDFSSVFYLNLFIATILYFILFITSPFIASIFEQPQLEPILKILSLTLFLGAFYSIQNAIIARSMQFKKLFFSSLGGVILSGFLGIALAYNHFGIWSLVMQQLVNQVVFTITLFYTVKWRPRLLFSIERLRILFSYGWKLLVSALIDSIYSNILNLIVGKFFSPAMLGFLNRGEQIPSVLISNINGSIQSVLFPAMAAQQDNRDKVKEIVKRSIVLSTFIIFPMMVGLAVIAEPLIIVLLTEKWLSAAPFLQIFCAVYALWPIHTANLQAINALGRSDIYLKLEIIKVFLGTALLIISIPFGVYTMVIGLLISGLLSMIINVYPNIKLLNYSLKEQFCDIFPAFLISLVMGIVVFSVKWIGLPNLTTIIIQILVGVIVYIGLAKIFRLEPFTYLLEMLKGLFGRNKKATVEEVYE